MNPSLVFLLAVLSLALVSMPVYALRGATRDADQEAKSAQFVGGAGAFVQHWFIWAIEPATTVSLKLGLTADFYNFAGLALGLASGVAIGIGRPELGGWAIALSGIADILDGRIARRMGVASKYGDFVDATLDRFVEVFALLGLVVYLRHHPYGPLLTATALAGSLLVSYARARGECSGVDCKGGLMQRTERLVLTLFGCLLDRGVTSWLGLAQGTLLLWLMGAISVGTFYTATYRTVWIARRLLEAGN